MSLGRFSTARPTDPASAELLYPGRRLVDKRCPARLAGRPEDDMFRKITISGLMGLLGLGALAAGATTITLVLLGALTLLGWIALGRRRS